VRERETVNAVLCFENQRHKPNQILFRIQNSLLLKPLKKRGLFFTRQFMPVVLPNHKRVQIKTEVVFFSIV